MQCSKCNESVTPVSVFDIDGTLGQYHQHFLEFANGYFNRKFQRYYGNLSLADHMGISKEEYRQCKLAYRLGSYKRTMPPYPGAPVLVQSARMCMSEVWLTTTRPYLRLDQTDPDTREWLARQDIIFDGLLYDEDKYKRLLEIVDPGRIVIVLEDDPEQYDRAEYLKLPVVLVQRSHNMGMWDAETVTAKDLMEAKALTIQRITDWKDRYGQ